MVNNTGWFSLETEADRSHNQKRRTFNDLVKTAFWKLGCRSRKQTKPITTPGNVHCDWFILPLLLPTPTIILTLGTRGFLLACDEELRRPQADTSSAFGWRHERQRRDKKKPLFSGGSLFKNWPKPETAHESLHENPDSGNPRLPLALKPLSQCSVPVSLCRVQVTGSLAVNRPDLFWASSSLVFKDWY